jgi:hypothetical protein
MISLIPLNYNQFHTNRLNFFEFANYLASGATSLLTKGRRNFIIYSQFAALRLYWVDVTATDTTRQGEISWKL